MIALSGRQLKAVMVAASPLPVEKRGLFLECVAALLARRRSFTDADLEAAMRRALQGLLQAPAA